MKHTLFVTLLACGVAPAADFATQVMHATHKLYHPASTATCLLVRGEGSEQALYLATARHALERSKGGTMIVVLREQGADGAWKRHDHTIPVRRDDQPLWVGHATADAAVLRLEEPTPVPVAPLPLAALADEARLVAAGTDVCDPVFVFTYPARVEANKAAFPVARQGIIAGHPLWPIERHPTLLASFTTFDGDSGGPLFIREANGAPLVLGLVVTRIRNDEKIKTQYEERTLHHPLDLGNAVHAQFLRELIAPAAPEEPETPAAPAAPATPQAPETPETSAKG